jgi:transglutaminase-like putative cysteine protease
VSTDPTVAATRILDWRHPLVADLAGELPADAGAIELLRAAHRLIAQRIRPVYSLDETQPVSRTIRRGRGSCSQRLAVLEALARASGIGTRVRGFLVDGRFWYDRFPRARFLVPDRVVLAWPEFRIGNDWVPVSELFGTLRELGAADGFTNTGGETLFDAVARTAVDWCGVTGSACDLSGQVRADLGTYQSRDELFARQGQTLCWPARTVAEPVLGHRRAG